MKELIDMVYQLLASDTTLLGLLPNNVPFNDKNGSNAKANSLVPLGLITFKMNTPLVSIGEGTESRIGTKLFDASFYVRCYNDLDKSTVEINAILERVRELLDEHIFALTSRRHVSTRYEASFPPLKDEEVNLKFKEQRYRVLYL